MADHARSKFATVSWQGENPFAGRHILDGMEFEALLFNAVFGEALFTSAPKTVLGTVPFRGQIQIVILARSDLRADK